MFSRHKLINVSLKPVHLITKSITSEVHKAMSSLGMIAAAHVQIEASKEPEGLANASERCQENAN